VDARELSSAYLRSLRTLATGQACDLKIDTGDRRVWISRCGPEDGEPYANRVTIERLRGGRWIEVDTYQAT
jgi:hypothetical protein